MSVDKLWNFDDSNIFKIKVSIGAKRMAKKQINVSLKSQ